MLERIVAEQDSRRIIEVFKEMIVRSYGVKSPDGKRFMKSLELADAFTQTEAYSNLFMELATNHEAAAAFINGIIPQTAEAAAAPAAVPAANPYLTPVS